MASQITVGEKLKKTNGKASLEKVVKAFSLLFSLSSSILIKSKESLLQQDTNLF